MQITEIAALAGTELSNTLRMIEESQVKALTDAICEGKKIYVSGVGRSLLMLRCFAMRLMHAGLESYVVGDTITPAFEKGDLLILGSGSGETAGLVSVADKARRLGGRIALITVRPASTLGRMADMIVEIPAYTDKVTDENKKLPILPGGSLFEQCMLLLGDAVFYAIARMREIPTDRPFAKHANLE